MQTALKFPQLERLATTSLSDYEKCSICLHRRSAPSSPLLSGPEQHMNSAERTKTPDLLFLHERKRMWGLSLARSRSPSPARQTNRQKQLTERMSRPPACVCVCAHIASSGATDGTFTVSICGSRSGVRTLLLLRVQGNSMFEKGHSTCLI